MFKCLHIIPDFIIHWTCLIFTQTWKKAVKNVKILKKYDIYAHDDINLLL